MERIAALFVIETSVRGQAPDQRLAARIQYARPRLDELKRFLQGSLKRISGKSALAGAIRYALTRWNALLRYLADGRLEMSNNAAERGMRAHIVMAGSLCIPSLSVWKHWKCVRVVNATRATLSGDRRLDRRRGNVVGADLVRRTSHDLHGRQNACCNQTPYRVVGDTQSFRRLAHGEPFAIFLR